MGLLDWLTRRSFHDGYHYTVSSLLDFAWTDDAAAPAAPGAPAAGYRAAGDASDAAATSVPGSICGVTYTSHWRHSGDFREINEYRVRRVTQRGARDLDTVWEHELDEKGYLDWGCGRFGDVIVAPYENGALLGLDAASGAVRWRQALGAPITDKPRVTPAGAVRVVLATHAWRDVDPATGALVGEGQAEDAYHAGRALNDLPRWPGGYLRDERHLALADAHVRIDGGGYLEVTRTNAPARAKPERVDFGGWDAEPPIVAYRGVVVVYLLQKRGPRESRAALAFLDADTFAVLGRLPLGECTDGILYCEQAHLRGPVLAVTAEFGMRDESTQSECHLVHLGARRRVGVMRGTGASTFFDPRGAVAWSVVL